MKKQLIIALVIFWSFSLYWCMEDIEDMNWAQDASDQTEQQNQNNEEWQDYKEEEAMQEDMTDEEAMEEDVEDMIDDEDMMDEEAMQDAMQQEMPSSPDHHDYIEEWHLVSLDYTGTDEDGEVFDTSEQSVAEDAGIYDENRPYQPLEFVVGAWQMIPGFEDAILWMEEWEVKEFEVTPDEWYWDYQEELVEEIPMEYFEQAGLEPVEDEFVNFGQMFGEITEIRDDEWIVIVDFNPPMAWENMYFEVEIHEIMDQDEQEIDPMQQP